MPAAIAKARQPRIPSPLMVGLADIVGVLRLLRFKFSVFRIRVTLVLGIFCFVVGTIRFVLGPELTWLKGVVRDGDNSDIIEFPSWDWRGNFYQWRECRY